MQRLITLAIPIFAVALPLLSAIPQWVQERLRERIHHLYARLRRVELQLEFDAPAVDPQALLRELDDIEASATQMQMPMSLAKDVFGLRRDVVYVRDKIRSRRG